MRAEIALQVGNFWFERHSLSSFFLLTLEG